MGIRPVTDVFKKGVGEVKGKSIAVVDTPDLFHTTLSNAEIQEEIVKCIYYSDYCGKIYRGRRDHFTSDRDDVWSESWTVQHCSVH